MIQILDLLQMTVFNLSIAQLHRYSYLVLAASVPQMEILLHSDIVNLGGYQCSMLPPTVVASSMWHLAFAIVWIRAIIQVSMGFMKIIKDIREFEADCSGFSTLFTATDLSSEKGFAVSFAERLLAPINSLDDEVVMLAGSLAGLTDLYSVASIRVLAIPKVIAGYFHFDDSSPNVVPLCPRGKTTGRGQ